MSLRTSPQIGVQSLDSIGLEFSSSAKRYLNRTIIICSSTDFFYSRCMGYNNPAFGECGVNFLLNDALLAFVSQFSYSDNIIYHTVSPTIKYAFVYIL